MRAELRKEREKGRNGELSCGNGGDQSLERSHFQWVDLTSTTFFIQAVLMPGRGFLSRIQLIAVGGNEAIKEVVAVGRSYSMLRKKTTG